MPTDLLPFILDPLISGLTKAGGLRVKREPGSQDHVIAEPAMTLQDLTQWLFEGRRQLPEQRLRPDPIVGRPEDPQKRFLFRPSPSDVRYLRKDFLERWYDSGPGWFLEEALPDWVPASVKTELGELDRAGGLRRSVAPVVRVFDGTPPWGSIIFWYGKGDFSYESQVYGEFPEDLQFYQTLQGGNISEKDAKFQHYYYTTYNREMRSLVVDEGWAPDNAKLEVRRRWGEVLKNAVEESMAILLLGQIISGLNRLALAASKTLEGMNESFRLNRQLFSLWARKRSPIEIIYRGATLRGIFRDVTRDLEHDFGKGTYLTRSRRVAELFAKNKRTEDDPGVVLRLPIGDRKVLGNTLDLVEGKLSQEWSASVAIRNQHTKVTLVNEQYNEFLTDFLKSHGKTIDEFDTIIGPDYLNGGIQICIKNDAIFEKLLSLADEIPWGF